MTGQRKPMGLKLNLGCGNKYLEGYVNCDVVPRVRADHYFDLNAPPYPFDDESAGEILMDNVLEHLDDVTRVLGELHRILEPGGRLRLLLPYGKTDWALQDPTHKHFFTEQSLNYFLEGHPYNYYARFRYRLVTARLYADSTTWRHKMRNLIPFRNLLRYYLWNMYDGLYFELEKSAAGSPPADAHA